MHYNILDFDQTLFHTRDALIKAYQRAFFDYDIPITIKQLRDNEGCSIDNIFDYLKIQEPLRSHIKKRKAKIYPDFFCEIVMNKRLLNLSNKIILSNAHSVDIQNILNYFHIKDILNIYGRNCVEALKPDTKGFCDIFRTYGTMNRYTIYDDQEFGLAAACKAAASMEIAENITLVLVTDFL